MTNLPDSNTNEDAIAVMAAEWFVEREEGFAPGRAEEFARWCQRDPRHQAAVAQFEATHQLLQRMPRLREDARLASRAERLMKPRRAPIIPFPLWQVAAAAAAVALAAAWWWRPGRVDFRQEYATTGDSGRKVTLPDESQIELSGRSDVVVAYSAQRRDIALVSGAANFSVAKDPARPFIVAAGKVQIRAVGTVFVVKYGTRAVEVRVTEGKVEVRREGVASAEAIVSALLAGQSLEIGTDGEQLAAAPAAASASTKPVVERLVFNGTPLAEVIEEFNRRNRIKIVLDDVALGDRPVEGTFDADKVEAFVRALESAGEVTTEWTHNSFVLRRGN